MAVLTNILIVIGVLTLYMRIRLNSEIAIDRLLTLATIIILFHGIHFHIVYTHFTCCPYLEALAPYRLLYSPMIYFSIQLAQIPAVKKSKKYLKIHLLPIIIFTISCLIFSFSSNLRGTYGELGFELLLLAEVLSYLAYAIASVILIYKSIGKSKWYPYMKALAETAVMLTILAGTYSLVQFFKEIDRNTYILARSYDFNLLLLVVTTALLFMLTIEQLITRNKPSKARSFIKKKTNSIPINKLKNNNEVQSSVPEEYTIISDKMEKELTDFLEKLDELVIANWFLNPEINVNSLAKETNTSTHFVSKVFNETLQVNFNQYINQLRIEYLVLTIKERIKEGVPIESIEELYFQAGFKSKSTFNRHFKKTMNQTPTQFINSLEKYV